MCSSLVSFSVCLISFFLKSFIQRRNLFVTFFNSFQSQCKIYQNIIWSNDRYHFVHLNNHSFQASLSQSLLSFYHFLFTSVLHDLPFPNATWKPPVSFKMLATCALKIAKDVWKTFFFITFLLHFCYNFLRFVLFFVTFCMSQVTLVQCTAPWLPKALLGPWTRPPVCDEPPKGGGT